MWFVDYLHFLIIIFEIVGIDLITRIFYQYFIVIVVLEIYSLHIFVLKCLFDSARTNLSNVKIVRSVRNMAGVIAIGRD